MANKIYPSLLIENYDYCLALSPEEFALYNWSENKIVFGKGTPRSFEGKEIKFLQDGEGLTAKHLYVGQM